MEQMRGIQFQPLHRLHEGTEAPEGGLPLDSALPEGRD